jgi:ribokinase
MIGRIGEDDFGQQLRQGLLNDSILLDHLTVAQGTTTGVALIMVDDSGQNRILIVSGANGTLSVDHIEAARELIERSEIVIVQLEIPLPTVVSAVELAARAGKKVLLNPAPAQALPATLLSLVDYLVLNEGEAACLSGIEVTDTTSAATAAHALFALGVRHVLLTLGSQGVIITDANGARHYPAPAVRAVDTTAAGDTFIGALAVGLVERMSLDSAAQLAVKAASLSVTRAGAQTSIPYRSEIT